VNIASSEGMVSGGGAANGEQSSRGRVQRGKRGGHAGGSPLSGGGLCRWSLSGNAVNPRVGSGLQQCSRRRSGANRRGGERPRGRNLISRWHEGSEGQALVVGSGVDGPNGAPTEGNLEKETRRSRWMVSARRHRVYTMSANAGCDFSGEGSTSYRKELGWSV
jgi:hypothetical protein